MFFDKIEKPVSQYLFSMHFKYDFFNGIKTKNHEFSCINELDMHLAAKLRIQDFHVNVNIKKTIPTIF